MSMVRELVRDLVGGVVGSVDGDTTPEFALLLDGQPLLLDGQHLILSEGGIVATELRPYVGDMTGEDIGVTLKNAFYKHYSFGAWLDKAIDDQLRATEEIRYPAIYFDPDVADDTGDGSLARPYKVFSAARLVPGYQCLIKAGTTITTGAGDPWFSIPATGTVQAPIIIGRYGSANVANPIINGAAATRIFRGALGAKNWRIRDLDIIGPGAGANRYAISQNTVDAVGDASTAFNIVLSGLRIRNVQTDGATDCNGIKLYGGDATIVNCELFDIADDGIWIHSYRAKISGCKIYRVAQSGRGAGDCIQFGAKSDGAVVRGNYLDHFDVDIKQCIYFEQTISVSDDVLIEDNYCVMADSNANAASPITCGATNSIVRRNFCKGGFVGIILGEGTIGHHNVVIQTVGRGIDCNSSAKAIHNTIVQTGSDTTQAWSVGVRITVDDSDVEVRNNLMIGQYNGILGYTSGGVQNFVESNNGFATRGVSDARVRVDGVVQAPTTSVVVVYADANTLVDADYRPLTASPLIGAAATVAYGHDGFDKDLSKIARSTIGAYA